MNLDHLQRLRIYRTYSVEKRRKYTDIRLKNANIYQTFGRKTQLLIKYSVEKRYL